MTPWDCEAEYLARCEGGVASQYFDRVILAWLRSGDQRPLADYLHRGHVPGTAVLNYIAMMMLDDQEFASCDSDILRYIKADEVPFRFVTKRRKGLKGRRYSREDEIRDLLLAKNVQNFMATGLSYDAAIATVKEAACKSGGALSISTIRAAYDKHANK